MKGRSDWRLWVIAAALVWAAAGLALEAREARRPEHWWSGLPPSFWRFGNPAVQEFSAFLDGVRPQVNGARRVVFAVPPGLRDQEMFLYLWAAYLLPDLRLESRVEAPRDPEARTWIAYRGAAPSGRGWRKVLELPQGAVYRRRKP